MRRINPTPTGETVDPTTQIIITAIDYVTGMVMWTLIGRTGMNFFLPINSPFFFMRAFVFLTDPVIRVFRPITPSFILEPLVPLYVAWFFYMFRFYLMPWLLGYTVMGMLAFPLESDIAVWLNQVFGKFLGPN